MDFLLLLIGLTLILVGANFLTDGSSAVAQRFRVPEFIIGLTIVAIGTSTPELVVSFLSALEGKGDIAIGNVVGSNIFNIFVIGGFCALIHPLPLTRSNIRRDIPFGVGASILLWIVTLDAFLFKAGEGQISRIEGIFMLACYIGLMYYTIKQSRPKATLTSLCVETDKDSEKPQSEHSQKQTALWLAIVMILGGLFGLIFGGNLFLEKAILLARQFGISESVIAITLVAGGTSLPELASSAVSVLKGKSDMALGNIIGSNIANILLILGVSSSITPLSMGGITQTDILMVLLGSILLFASAFSFRKKEIDRIEGGIFLVLYAIYIYFLIQ